MRRLLTLLTLALAFLTLFSFSGESAKAQGPGEDLPPINDRAAFRRPTAEVLQLEGQLRGDVETRMSLGLNADVDYVQSLRGSDQDVGSKEVNIPLTQAEYDEVQARWAFADGAARTVLPYVEGLPTFGGAFFDHSSRGDLVILLTEDDAEVRSRIDALAPEGRVTQIEIVAYTEQQLRQAIESVWEVWASRDGPQLYSVAADVPANALRVEVAINQLGSAQEVAQEIGTRIGVPIFVTPGAPTAETACTSRSNCYSPMKAGIKIWQGAWGCTMGFHVIKNGDTQFLTAGHCGYNDSSNSWSHDGYGYIGTEQATRYWNGGSDIMRIQMSNSQGSSALYSSYYPASAAQHPYTGMGICADLGHSNVWKCGTVTDNYLSWTGPNCNCTVYGGDSSITAILGDSGSPMVTGTTQNIAIGIVADGSGLFARVKDTLDTWGWAIR